MRVLYNGLLVLVLVLGAPLWLALVLLSPRLRRDFGERLRPLPGRPPGGVWLHAASVGEVEASAPLLEGLLARGIAVVATTQTTTGRDRLRQKLPALAVRLAPLDLPGLMDRSVAGAGVVVLVETELWPNLIWAARRAGARVLIVSARLSDGTLPVYRSLRFLLADVLRDVRVLARGPEDAARFRAIGAAAERVTEGGDLKLDRPPPPSLAPALADALGPGPFLVGASTHAGEEEALFAAWRRLGAHGAQLRLLVAPRHPERAPQVADTLARAGARVGLRSKGAAEHDVVVLDTIGELGAIYGQAELVFVGGSLAPVGGHNLVEPVQAGRVVVHGPHLANQRTQQRLLAPLGVLHEVADAAELGQTLARLWEDPERHRPAAAARASLVAHRGATERALREIEELLRA